MKKLIIMSAIVFAMVGCGTLEESLKEGQKIVINGEVYAKTNGVLEKVSLYNN